MGKNKKYDVSATHRVAVGAYIFDDKGRMLLLHRRNPPRIYAPPGGRLEPDENPNDGILREVYEESGISIKLLGPAFIWFGQIVADTPPFVGIDYIAKAFTTDVVLSDEHDDFLWADKIKISSGEITTITADGYGYDPQKIIEAFELYNLLIPIL